MRVKVCLKDGRSFTFGETAIFEDKEAGRIVLGCGKVSGGRLLAPGNPWAASKYKYEDESSIAYRWQDVDHFEIRDKNEPVEEPRKADTETATKPCPFCGGENIEVVDNSDPNTGEQDWLICCGNCGSAFIASNDAMPCTRSDLIKRWNNRTWKTAAPKDGIWYWPIAVTKEGENLFTHDSVRTMEKALQQFSIWEDFYNYKIAEAWVEDSNGKRIEVERRWTVKEEGDANGNPE